METYGITLCFHFINDRFNMNAPIMEIVYRVYNSYFWDSIKTGNLMKTNTKDRQMI